MQIRFASTAVVTTAWTTSSWEGTGAMEDDRLLAGVLRTGVRLHLPGAGGGVPVRVNRRGPLVVLLIRTPSLHTEPPHEDAERFAGRHVAVQEVERATRPLP